LPEVVIIGGGIVGLCAAWSVRRRGAAVTVLERGVCGQGSTAKATGGIRTQFGSEVNVRLTLASLPFFRSWTDIHGADIGYREIGYLFLATTPAHIAAQARGARLQRRCGARIDLLTASDIGSQVPGISMDGVLGGSFGPDDGLADPGAAVSSLVSSCRRSGVMIEEGLEVEALVFNGPHIAGVQTTLRKVTADVVLIAAGPWSPPLLAKAGFRMPVTPRHRQVYRSVGALGLPTPCPFVVDVGTGIYFHTDGTGLVFGGGDRHGTPGLDESFRPEEAPRIIELLARRLPAVLETRLTGGWAGIRDMTPDDHGIVGRLPETEGALVAVGFSGHGFMHAPAIGEEIARMIVGEPAVVDVSSLSPNRFGSRLHHESYVF
jgi:sarcosine oxidase subunit beta